MGPNCGPTWKSMNRGELWTAMGGSEYLTKPRPTLIVQGDQYPSLDSVVVCPLTTIVSVAARFRVTMDASVSNGLEERSAVMVDKTVAVKRSRLGQRIGQIDPDDMSRVTHALTTFLDL